MYVNKLFRAGCVKYIRREKSRHTSSKYIINYTNERLLFILFLVLNLCRRLSVSTSSSSSFFFKIENIWTQFACACVSQRNAVLSATACAQNIYNGEIKKPAKWKAFDLSDEFRGKRVFPRWHSSSSCSSSLVTITIFIAFFFFCRIVPFSTRDTRNGKMTRQRNQLATLNFPNAQKGLHLRYFWFLPGETTHNFFSISFN